ncbi:unnamed protein product, partial [marine sediment metagenome]
MRKVIVNFSGGKDSTAAILKVLEKYPKDEVLLCYQDTGAEYLETVSHVQQIAVMLELPLVILKPERDFWQEVEHRRFFPTPGLRWCTGKLKQDIFNKWLSGNFRGKGYEIVVVTGIRGDESFSRSKLHEFEDPSDHRIVKSATKLWYPCLYMTAKEVKD